MIVLRTAPDAPGTTMASMLLLAQRKQAAHGGGRFHSVRIYTPEPHSRQVDLGPAWNVPASPDVLAALSEFGEVEVVGDHDG